VKLHRYDIGAPLADLVEETRRVVAGRDWREGAFGHALSLPAPAELHPYRRYSYQNFPSLGVLDRCPALRAVFDGLRSEKVSFRLLRRAGRSAYAWHTDQWKGPGVVRFQIPIVSDARAFLVATDYAHVAQVRGSAAGLSDATFAAFEAENAGHVARHSLSPGLLHYFDTSRVHTLVNAGDDERITLSFDLFANDWVRERFPEVTAELGAGAPAALPRPGAVRHAVARAASYLHPWRTRLHHRLHGPAA
jgi:hypothetical protein